MSKSARARIIRIITVMAVITIAAVIYFPRPLVGNPENCRITSVLYRADDWENLRYFYPSPETGQSINEPALLQYLHQKRCIRRLLPFTSDGIPSERVTIEIFVSDGEKSKQIILGDINEERVENGKSVYTILGASSVLSDVLCILGIDEIGDYSGLRPIAY